MNAKPEPCSICGRTHREGSKAARVCAIAAQATDAPTAPTSEPTAAVLVTARDLEHLVRCYGPGAILRSRTTGLVLALALRPGATVEGYDVLVRRDDAVSYYLEFGSFHAAATQLTAELRAEAERSRMALAA